MKSSQHIGVCNMQVRCLQKQHISAIIDMWSLRTWWCNLFIRTGGKINCTYMYMKSWNPIVSCLVRTSTSAYIRVYLSHTIQISRQIPIRQARATCIEMNTAYEFYVASGSFPSLYHVTWLHWLYYVYWNRIPYFRDCTFRRFWRIFIKITWSSVVITKLCKRVWFIVCFRVVVAFYYGQFRNH